MTCGDGERTRSRACTAGCSNIDDNDSNHSLIQSEVCNQTECPQRCGTLTWNDSIQVEENQLLAGGLQMNTTFRLRFEVFLRSTGPNTWRSVFFANDGPTITRHNNNTSIVYQCGQRLPVVFLAPQAYYAQRSGFIF